MFIQDYTLENILTNVRYVMSDTLAGPITQNTCEVVIKLILGQRKRRSMMRFIKDFKTLKTEAAWMNRRNNLRNSIFKSL